MVWPVRPWRMPLREERRLPSSVRGPVDFWALSRLMVARALGGPVLSVSVVLITDLIMEEGCGGKWGVDFVSCWNWGRNNVGRDVTENGPISRGRREKRSGRDS